MSQQELGKRLGISGNYVYLIESGQKNPGPSLLKLFETMEVSPLYQGEFSKDTPGGTRFEGSALGVFDRFGTDTLKQSIADQASHLPTADPHTVFSIIESMREMMSILSTRLRSRPGEASSRPPSELQAAAKRASASAKTDPSE